MKPYVPVPKILVSNPMVNARSANKPQILTKRYHSSIAVSVHEAFDIAAKNIYYACEKKC